MKRNIIITLGLTITAILMAVNAMAGCTIYKNQRFLGDSIEMAAGQEISSFERGWDNQISALKVSSGCKLTVWKDSDFQGDKKEFTEDAAFIGNSWDDIISSAKCSCQQAD
jgi:hypothetical protein